MNQIVLVIFLRPGRYASVVRSYVINVSLFIYFSLSLFDFNLFVSLFYLYLLGNITVHYISITRDFTCLGLGSVCMSVCHSLSDIPVKHYQMNVLHSNTHLCMYSHPGSETWVAMVTVDDPQLSIPADVLIKHDIIQSENPSCPCLSMVM